MIKIFTKKKFSEFVNKIRTEIRQEYADILEAERKDDSHYRFETFKMVQELHDLVKYSTQDYFLYKGDVGRFQEKLSKVYVITKNWSESYPSVPEDPLKDANHLKTMFDEKNYVTNQREGINQIWNKAEKNVSFELPNELALNLCHCFDQLQIDENRVYDFSEDMKAFHNALLNAKVFTQAYKSDRKIDKKVN